MNPYEELATLLRPAGGGLFLVSTGRAEQIELQKTIYGAATEEEVGQKWRAALAEIAAAKVVILGAPSDVGAGFLRGANMGPQAIRQELLKAKKTGGGLPAGVVDAGDVFVVPQLLHDDMLAPAQREASARALYPGVEPAVRASLPVSPLSILERAIDLLFAINPKVVPIVLGGDHSCAWPVSAALARARAASVNPANPAKPAKPAWGIVQMDAHTDLLEERLGIRYCFATWSYHASRLLARPDHMVQVGIRATRHPRAHWENDVGVRQFWADECNRDPAAAIDAIVEHLLARGIESIYFSNDIDGTDDQFADATGTPEPHGLQPDFVLGLIHRLGKEFHLCAGDIMEVAPPIPRYPGGTERTVALAAQYITETITAALR
ncbi:arginase family protein [Pendulispora rubella]|uniref:Arginase family protein n=1 Tax=Pendulispora rubella TaxID=2741070 RepID=A0ABZ2LEA9_9BACT